MWKEAGGKAKILEENLYHLEILCGLIWKNSAILSGTMPFWKKINKNPTTCSLLFESSLRLNYSLERLGDFSLGSHACVLAIPISPLPFICLNKNAHEAVSLFQITLEPGSHACLLK